MGTEVFSRYEKKYFLTLEQYSEFLDRIGGRLEQDEYNRENGLYTICNLYCDTPDNELIRHSMEKPTYKEKLRIRGYGVPGLDAKVYVEVKKKVDGLVNKRRTSMKLREAYDFVASGKVEKLKPYMNPQVCREIEYMLAHQRLAPKLYLAYDRHAMFAKDGHDLRITFDCNIRTRREDLRMENGDHGEQLLDPGFRLMEVKAERSVPLWLARTMSEMKLYPASFSKYGAEYQQFILETNLHETNLKGRTKPCPISPSLQNYLLPQTEQLLLAMQ